MFRQKYDFVAIGDLTTDAFIQLQDAEVHCDVDRERCLICMRFGDKIPYHDVRVIPAVGNSANAAVSAARLGLRSAFVVNIGDDNGGKEALKVLKEEKVGTDFVKVHKNKPTNYHYVLSFHGERTILVKHQSYDYKLPPLGSPKWIYLSSTGESALPLHKEIEEYLEKNPDVHLAFQPGTYQIKFGREKLAGIYSRAAVFFSNKEEAQKVLGVKEEDIKELLDGIYRLGPKIAVITEGRSGAYAREGNDYWFMPAYPDPKPPLERTGAGDAFSSAFSAALAYGKGIEEALRWGPVNSMSVVQQVGARAGLLTKDQLEKLLADAPANYRPKRI